MWKRHFQSNHIFETGGAMLKHVTIYPFRSAVISVVTVDNFYKVSEEQPEQ